MQSLSSPSNSCRRFSLSVIFRSFIFSAPYQRSTATHSSISRYTLSDRSVKAKFHYAICFEAGRRPASNQLRTSSEPASVMECWFKQQPACLSSHTVDLRWTMDDVLLYSTHPVEQLAVNVNQMRKRFCYNSAHIHKVTVT